LYCSFREQHPERPFRPSVVSFVGSSFRSCGPSVTRLRVSDQPPSDDPSGLRPAGLPALRRRTGCDIPPATCPAFAFLVLRPSAARPPSVSPVPRLSGFPYSAGPFAPFGVALLLRFLDPALSVSSLPLPGIERQPEGAASYRSFPPVTPTGDWIRPVGSGLLVRRR
jgi:hypothetical protein